MRKIVVLLSPVAALAISLLLFSGGLCVAQTMTPPVVATWPGDRTAAISLTFDDAMATQLDNVGPILKKYGIHGTFFVITGVEDWRKRIAEWKRLSLQGNEIGGHTVNHPCLQPQIKPHAQDYTPAMMEAEIRGSAQTILAGIGEGRGLTFAYPCGNMSFGPPLEQTRNAALYQRYVSEHFFAARGYSGPRSGRVASVAADELSILTVPDLGFTADQGFPELIEMAEPALRNHRWGIFTFHGIGGEWLSVSTEALDELAAYLARHPEIWTATFGDGVRYIQESKALGIRAAKSGDGEARFDLSWPLDAKTYDLPVTLKWSLPEGWSAVQAYIEEKPAATSVRQTGRVLLLDVPPGAASVRFVSKPSAGINCTSLADHPCP
jgi:peptidoglycan/xylan/chitin deacetylase (PgdA/CDA1 family)